MKYLILIFLALSFYSCGKEEKKSDPPRETPSPNPKPDPKPNPNPGDKLSYSDVSPIIERSCSPCHFGNKPKAGFGLDSESKLRKNLPKAINKVNQGEMPPEDSGKPTISSNDQLDLVNWYNGR